MNVPKNVFATVLTQTAPSSNYRGESEENRTVIQKISKDGGEYAVVSPESMRNALREQLATYGLPMNRRRLHNEDQLAVEFRGFPDAELYADDFLFGFMVADQKAVKAAKGKPAKRDSLLRMNMAVATTPYRFDATFHQSPLNAGESPWKNSSSSALLHREVSHTSYQFPFALALHDCASHEKQGSTWTKALLRAVGELSNVAGNHARSYFEMAPRSLVLRLTPNLVAGFDTYGFRLDGRFPELSRIKNINGKGDLGDLPGEEFWVGGEIVRSMPEAERKRLVECGVHLFENPQRLLAEVSDSALGAN